MSEAGTALLSVFPVSKQISAVLRPLRVALAACPAQPSLFIHSVSVHRRLALLPLYLSPYEVPYEPGRTRWLLVQEIGASVSNRGRGAELRREISLGVVSLTAPQGSAGLGSM